MKIMISTEERSQFREAIKSLAALTHKSEVHKDSEAILRSSTPVTLINF
jgi:hypothetical protein